MYVNLHKSANSAKLNCLTQVSRAEAWIPQFYRSHDLNSDLRAVLTGTIICVWSTLRILSLSVRRMLLHVRLLRLLIKRTRHNLYETNVVVLNLKHSDAVICVHA